MAWWTNKIMTLAALAGCLATAEPAWAQAASPLPADWLARRVDDRGQHCDRRDEHRDAKTLLLACGAAGVWEVALDDAGPRFVRSFEFSGDVVGFVVEPDGRLWVKLQVLEARPFTSTGAPQTVTFPDAATTLPPLAPPPVVSAPAPAPPPATSGARRVGRVTRTELGQVVISLGSLDGVTPRDRIELALEHGDGSTSEDAALSRETVAVGTVTNVTKHSARVQLGMNEDVPVGALATPTIGLLTSSLSAPPRVSGLWELELFARPFAALGELGGGALFSGAFGYRLPHLHLQAIVDPLGLGDVQGKAAVASFNAAAIASYDSQYFEMGLGLGGQTVNDTTFLLEPGTGWAVLQLIRLGAQDGLNISARTNIVLFHSEFQFGGMVASGQIPVTPGYWVLFNGGGGGIGYGYGELGLRVLLTGNGLRGSKFLTVTAGGAAVFRSGVCDQFFNCQTLVYGGPMAGIGGEWRF